MKLNKINRSTHYIDAPTNIGIYIFKNKNVLLIDTGINKYAAKKIEDILINNNLHPKYVINTHSHTDHCGGNNYFKENYPGIEFFSSNEEKIFIENPVYHQIISSSAYPSKKMKIKNGSKIDYVLNEEMIKINDEKFQIFLFPGHTNGDIAILTNDRVCFMGDSIFSKDTLEKYPLTYLLNIEQRVDSILKMKEIDADYFVISHSEKILDKNDFMETIEENLKNIDKINKEIIEICSQPMTREDILQEFLILHDLEVDYKGYYVDFCAISAYLNFLINEEEIEVSIQEGKLYFYKK
ncbi:MAG: hypothetical protein PWP28_2266 [Oceanotoga sp.]|uniref:MBL fold metallo-hydrolase n=1 Tax=Oceanotoga sp. TaxID=2108366 RepID=UPI00264F9070|nr:MBL fold metallo-hydrolase [Oceanotoga sp.]MDN5343386.1 hypothetical protein [Oceanotoga sp.]